jgi:hypothetical protein
MTNILVVVLADFLRAKRTGSNALLVVDSSQSHNQKSQPITGLALFVFFAG